MQQASLRALRLEKSGKPFKVVITACMRKLLVILNALVKKHSLESRFRKLTLDKKHSRTVVKD